MATETFHGDRPIQSPDNDRFGFGALAERIADALTTQAAGKGFVLGIEGKWGSGKSSLLALTLARLRSMPSEEVAAIEFRPWLIGDRDQLLVSLFDELVKAIAGLEHAGGDATSTSARAAGDVAKKVRKFASHLGPLGKLTSVAGLLVPGATIAGDIIEKIAAAAKEQESGPALAEQKEELAASLIKLNCRIVVTIDDVDRLEPKEVAELLRLVRSVADFPNISYLLCYDAGALAHAIENATGVESGNSYLEKIIQTEISVPRPESFALRRWFSSELRTFAQCSEERVPDLLHVIDETGGRSFETARTVVRVLDSLRVYWPSLKERIDLPDLVWLRIIAVASPNLYRWIEEYLTEYAAFSAGRVQISEPQRDDLARRFDVALEQDGLSWKTQQFELERRLPGINSHSFNSGKDERLFSKGQRVSPFHDAKYARLASPSHSRLYFSLVEPPDSVTERDIAELLSAAGQGSDFVATLLLQMGRQKGDTGATKAEKLLDQLRYIDANTLAIWPAETVVMGVANSTDDLAKGETGDNWGYPRVWYLVKQILKRLSSELPSDRWEALIKQMFHSGTSIAFLSYLLRDETFGHGFFGDRPDPNDRLTSPDIFESIRKTMLARYAAEGIDTLIQKDAAATILYAWSQAGGQAELSECIASRAIDDKWFIDFLMRISSRGTSSEGSYPTLSLEGIGTFFNSPTLVVKRAIALAKTEPPISGAQTVVDAVKANMRLHGNNFEQALDAYETSSRTAESSSLVADSSLRP